MADLIAGATHGAGLGTTAARWVFVFIWFCGVSVGLIDGYFTPLDPLNATAYLAGLVGALILTTPGTAPLPLRRSLWLPIIALYIVALVLPKAPELGNIPAILFAMYLVAFAIPRGNQVIGGLGSALVISYISTWALANGASSNELISLLVIPIGSVVAGVIWRVVLGWIVAEERHHRTAAGRAAARTAAALEAIRASQRELMVVRAEVGPLLEEIARGKAIDAETRVALVRVEAAVRDRIRAPHLQHPDLVAAFARLRDRKVTVVVLGEPIVDGGLVDEALVTRLIEVTSSIKEGRVTVRTLPSGRRAAVSVVLQGPTESEQILLTANGATVSRG